MDDKIQMESPILSDDDDDGEIISGSLNLENQLSEIDMMNERFAKLLLGEDMSGGGKGVSSALALTNAITNLAASVFGEQYKLESMSPQRKARWKTELDWLLSVTDHIVEFVPSQQVSENGTNMEIMVTQQRRDLMLSIPALRKLDAMLLGVLDNFVGQNEFWYVSRDADESEKGIQKNEKWWLPTVKVPPNGLSEESRQVLLTAKDSVNQVLKAAMAINAHILSDMEIPDDYIESLPKNGKASLGDSIYRSMSDDFFDPQEFLSAMDLSSEHAIVDLKNRIEASIVIWKRKMHHKDGRSGWTSALSFEKREVLEERAETVLLLLKHKFPGLAQSSLDISKIEYNKDIGLSILESYSRVLESLANTVMSRIEDVIYADSVAQDTAIAIGTPSPTLSSFASPHGEDEDEEEEMEDKLSSAGADTPSSAMTLSDFMGWTCDPPESEIKKNHSDDGNEEEKIKIKPRHIKTKMLSYLDKLEMTGFSSPTPRR